MHSLPQTTSPSIFVSTRTSFRTGFFKIPRQLLRHRTRTTYITTRQVFLRSKTVTSQIPTPSLQYACHRRIQAIHSLQVSIRIKTVTFEVPTPSLQYARHRCSRFSCCWRADCRVAPFSTISDRSPILCRFRRHRVARFVTFGHSSAADIRLAVLIVASLSRREASNAYRPAIHVVVSVFLFD